MKKPLIILKAAFLFGGPVVFAENITKSTETAAHQQALNDVTVTRIEGDGGSSQATVDVKIIVREATERHYIYKETEDKGGELEMKVADSKNTDVSFEYYDIDEKKIRKSMKRVAEENTHNYRGDDSLKKESKENLYVNLSHLDSHHNKKGRLVVVTKYR